MDAIAAHGSLPAACAALGIAERDGKIRATIARDKLGAETLAEAVNIWKARQERAA